MTGPFGVWYGSCTSLHSETWTLTCAFCPSFLRLAGGCLVFLGLLGVGLGDGVLGGDLGVLDLLLGGDLADDFAGDISLMLCTESLLVQE